MWRKEKYQQRQMPRARWFSCKCIASSMCKLMEVARRIFFFHDHECEQRILLCSERGAMEESEKRTSNFKLFRPSRIVSVSGFSSKTGLTRQYESSPKISVSMYNICTYSYKASATMYACWRFLQRRRQRQRRTSHELLNILFIFIFSFLTSTTFGFDIP